VFKLAKRGVLPSFGIGSCVRFAPGDIHPIGKSSLSVLSDHEKVPIAPGSYGRAMKQLLLCGSRYVSLHTPDGDQPITERHQARDIKIAPMM